MAVAEHDNRHEYRFDDTRVDKSTLLSETLDALEKYDFLYQQNREGYFENLQSKIWSYFYEDGVKYTGYRKDADLHYGKITETGSSHTDAVIWQNVWANSVTPRSTPEEIFEHTMSENGTGADSNSWAKLILADFMHFTLKQAGVRDGQGDTLPVISIPSPSLDRRGFVRKSSGVKPLARLALDTADLCNQEGFNGLYLGGVSQGASASGELVRTADKNFDINSAFFGELPNVAPRTMPTFGRDYITDAKGVDGNWTEDGPKPRTDSRKGSENTHMAGQAGGNRNAVVNLRLFKDMCRGKFVEVLPDLYDRKIPTTLEYGDTSKVSDSVPGLLHYHHACQLRHKGLLQMLVAKNGPHTHSEHIVQTVDAMLRSIKFAKKT